MLSKLLIDMTGIARSLRMNKDEEADLINEIVIAQGELLRLMIWAKRLYTDLEPLKKLLILDENK